MNPSPRCASPRCNLARSERNVCSRCDSITCDLHFFAPVGLCESCADAAEANAVETIPGCPGCDPAASGALCEPCEAAFLADQSIDEGVRRCPKCGLSPCCGCSSCVDDELDELDEAPRLEGRRS